MGIVVIGATFVDLKGYPLDIFNPSGRNAGKIEQVHGGVCRNIVYDLAQVDLKPTFLSVLDQSALSTEILEVLNKRHVETKYIQRTESGLGKWLALFDDSGDVYASISQRPDLSILLNVFDQNGDEIFSRCDGIVIEIDQEEEILECVFSYAQKYRKNVYAVVSNMSIAKKRKYWIRQCACLVCNLEEAEILFDKPLMNENLDRRFDPIQQVAIQQGLFPIVVTMGKEGAIYIESKEQYGYVCTQKVEVVDTTGCGDAFFAGVVMGLTYGKSLEQACQIGTILACSVIQTKENVCPRFSYHDFDLNIDMDSSM